MVVWHSGPGAAPWQRARRRRCYAYRMPLRAAVREAPFCCNRGGKVALLIRFGTFHYDALHHDKPFSGLMTVAGRIALTAARLVQHRAGAYADRALQLAQRGAREAADRAETAGPRLVTLAEAGLKLTEITCRCLDRLVRQGLESAEGALSDGVERLRMTASARTLEALYGAQWAAIPATRRRVAHDLEATWRIVASTSRELAELAHSTRSELARETAGRARKSTRRGRRPAAAGRTVVESTARGPERERAAGPERRRAAAGREHERAASGLERAASGHEGTPPASDRAAPDRAPRARKRPSRRRTGGRSSRA